jgi:hypothetical protein
MIFEYFEPYTLANYEFRLPDTVTEKKIRSYWLKLTRNESGQAMFLYLWHKNEATVEKHPAEKSTFGPALEPISCRKSHYLNFSF